MDELPHKNRKAITIIVIAGIAAVFMGLAIKVVVRTHERMQEDLRKTYYTDRVSKDDSSLFKETAWDSLKVNNVFHTPGNNPVSFLTYNQRLYIALYRFDLKDRPDLLKAISIKEKREYQTSGIDYSLLPISDFFTCKLASGSSTRLTNLHLTLYGDDVTSAASDSIVVIQLAGKNISLRFDDDPTVRLFITGQEGLFMRIQATPLGLAFLRKGNSIYMLAVTPESQTDTISPALWASLLVNY